MFFLVQLLTFGRSKFNTSAGQWECVQRGSTREPTGEAPPFQPAADVLPLVGFMISSEYGAHLLSLQLSWSHWLMSLLCLSDSRYEKCMCLLPQDKKRTALTCTSVQTDVGWWAAGPPLQAICLRLSTLVDYWWRWRPATFILLLCTDRHIYHVRVLQDPSQSICLQLKAIIFVSLRFYWLDKPVWCFRDAAVAEMNKVTLACLLLFSLFSGIFCVPLQRWTQQVMIRGL